MGNFMIAISGRNGLYHVPILKNERSNMEMARVCKDTELQPGDGMGWWEQGKKEIRYKEMNMF